jgi:transglutaminase-like putative cysteine protease
MNYTVLWIPPGRRGTRATLRIMARLARQAQLVPIVRETALKIVPTGNDPLAGAARIKEFVRVKIRHIDESIEMIHEPAWMLKEIAAGRPVSGDCDDEATLFAALVFSIGIPVRFVAVRRADARDFEHVFAEVLIDAGNGGQWIMQDPRYEQMPAGNWIAMFQEVRFAA